MSTTIMSTPTKPVAPATKSNPTSSALKKKSTSLPAETVDYLKAWMMSPEHIAHPYPTEQEKAQIMADTGIELKQLTNWFVNNRKRYWKPRVEARLQHQTVAAPVNVNVNQQVVVNQSLQSSQSLLAPAPLVVDRPLATTQEQPVSTIAASPAASLVRRVSTASLSQHLHNNALCVSDASSQYSSDAESGESGSVSEGGDDDMAAYCENTAASSNDEVSNEDSVVARTESVNVHILRPLNATRRPTIADVSILATVPAERILCTYENCPLKYSFPLDSIQDRKKVSLICRVVLCMVHFTTLLIDSVTNFSIF